MVAQYLVRMFACGKADHHQSGLTDSGQISKLFCDVLEGKIEPGCVFDPVVYLDEMPACYHAIDKREAIIKVMVKL